MKLIQKWILLFFVVPVLVYSCQKQKDVPFTEENEIDAENKKPLEPGFADNDMVMFWNEKAATVLKNISPQPIRARLFAYIEVTVHDALNSIKPKFQRYALVDAKKQFASPDAAVASSAYWAIKKFLTPAQLAPFALESWYAQSLATITDGESKEQGIALGIEAAEAMYEKRNENKDGYALRIMASPFPANGTFPGEYRQTELPNLRQQFADIRLNNLSLAWQWCI